MRDWQGTYSAIVILSIILNNSKPPFLLECTHVKIVTILWFVTGLIKFMHCQCKKLLSIIVTLKNTNNLTREHTKYIWIFPNFWVNIVQAWTEIQKPGSCYCTLSYRRLYLSGTFFIAHELMNSPSLHQANWVSLRDHMWGVVNGFKAFKMLTCDV